ncbi:MAG: winged helix-turn-helix domain-containing protein [Fimbriimonadaceae bacterium]
MGAEIFGSEIRTSILVLIQGQGETHAAELASMLGVSPQLIGHHLDKLEEEKLIVRRSVGKTRVTSMNPSFSIRVELTTLLEKMYLNDPFYQEATATMRKRPRAKGKEI